LYRRILIKVPRGKKPLYFLERKGKVLFYEFEKEVKRAGNRAKEFRKIREWIFLRAEGRDIAPSKRERLLGSDGTSFAYRCDRMRVLSFEDGEAEIIADGIPSKRDEDYSSETAKLEAIKGEYFALLNSDELPTINEKDEAEI